MKKLIIGLLILGSFSTFADDSFDQFLGKYQVTSQECKSTSSYLETLEVISIKKGTSFNRNLEDTFIAFKRGGYYTSETNLSAFSRLINYSQNGGAIFNAKDSKAFTMEKLSETKFSFTFFAIFGESIDDCIYNLELIY
jgi:hypothetical protein